MIAFTIILAVCAIGGAYCGLAVMLEDSLNMVYWGKK